MTNYWLISDRDQSGTGGERDPKGLSYFVSPGGNLSDLASWEPVSQSTFQTLLAAAADKFPLLDHADNENQSHITLLVHGYNVGFANSTQFYQNLCDRLFSGSESLGICVLFDWPSLGSVLGYEPDRLHARQCADDLTVVLCSLFDWLLKKQQDAIVDPSNACKAKVSLIAHSMGNYLLQKAMADTWTRKNQPMLVSLINQLLMVAADVDNDLFDAGAPDNDDGAAIAHLSYRITALYSGRDAVLGASSGLKHFGTRRLGRAGLAHRPPLVNQPPGTDNVWDVDCSSFFPATTSPMAIHGAYFVTDETILLMRKILQGVDRGVLTTLDYTQGNAWPLNL